MKVCWLNNYFSPYKMKLFDRIGSNVELTALTLGGTDDSHRNEEWKLSNNYSFNVVLIDKNFNKTIKKLAKENDVLIDSMYSTSYGIKAVNEFKKRGKKVLMHADGGIPIDRWLLNIPISFIMKRHNLFISSGPHCDKYYNFYGIKDEKIRHYHFSSLNEKDIIQNRKMINNKKEYRNLLNIDNKFTFISVGKPVKGKGFDILLKAYKESGLSEDANLLIIGGEPQDDTKEFVEKNKLNNVHFIGLLNGEELKKYYAASDAFILCTRTDVWGLVILESMSFGLPVITSNNCGAGVHFNLLTNNVRICDVEDYIEYGHVMQDVYKDNNLKNKSEEIFNVISEYTIENGCKDIIDILESI